MTRSATLDWRDCVVPDWPASAHVFALSTTRQGGVTSGTRGTLNLGRSVNDSPEKVAENRARLEALVAKPIFWMGQVHGTDVINMDAGFPDSSVRADAQLSHGAVCAVTTADCLPLLFCDRAGTVVAAAHAGWRGLCAGVIESTVSAMSVPSSDLLVYLAPAIGPAAFEVGPDVRDAFLQADVTRGVSEESTLAAFSAVNGAPSGATSKWMADIYALARNRLAAIGVPETQIYGGMHCTYTDEARFFSHRRATHRAEPTGRMASMIWIDHDRGHR
jgi:polyphenol oxidase